MSLLIILGAIILTSCGSQELNSPASSNDTVTNGHDNNPRSPQGDSSDDALSSKIFCQVQQIFDDNCIQCHSASGTKPALVRSLTSINLINKPSKSGAFLVKPGLADQSEIFQRINTNNMGKRMPKGEPQLKASDIALIKTWIDDGASTDC